MSNYHLNSCSISIIGCGHCKRAKPEFNKAAETFKDDPRIGIAAVDCTKHNAVCSAYSVRGFPTIKYFSYLKTVREYNGGRTAEDFTKFLSDPDAQPEKPKAEEFGKYPGADSIITLTGDKFHETAKKIDNLLVMFYAPCLCSLFIFISITSSKVLVINQFFCLFR